MPMTSIVVPLLGGWTVMNLALRTLVLVAATKQYGKSFRPKKGSVSLPFANASGTAGPDAETPRSE
jgi:hypothetical protein